MTTVLTILLQRSRDSRDDTDDKICIYSRASQFDIRYLDGETKRTHYSVFSRVEVLSYISILLHALSIDGSPFYCIQVMPSGFPSIVYSISEIEHGSPGWETLTTTLKWAIEGRWTILPQVLAPVAQYPGTSVSNGAHTYPSIPEFVPLTARVSLQPPGVSLQSFVLEAVESMPTVSS